MNHIQLVASADREADHCLEMLRQNLMCESDIGVITMQILPERGDNDPWPDFNTPHVCRNFEAIKDWADANTISHTDAF